MTTNPFIVEGVEPDGSRTELASFDNSAEARNFLGPIHSGRECRELGLDRGL